MKVTITQTNKAVPIGDLKVGDMFLYEDTGGIYMKTQTKGTIVSAVPLTVTCTGSAVGSTAEFNFNTKGIPVTEVTYTL